MGSPWAVLREVRMPGEEPPPRDVRMLAYLINDGDPRYVASWPKGWSAAQRRNAALGRHPFGMPFADNGETCGTCAYAFKSNDWWKCERMGVTGGPGTDLRVGWPACTLWKEIPDE